MTVIVNTRLAMDRNLRDRFVDLSYEENISLAEMYQEALEFYANLRTGEMNDENLALVDKWYRKCVTGEK